MCQVSEMLKPKRIIDDSSDEELREWAFEKEGRNNRVWQSGDDHECASVLQILVGVLLLLIGISFFVKLT